jgi:hypothetical protein
VSSRPAFKIPKGCTRLAVASDKVYQLLVHGLWFSSGTPVSSTTKTGRHDIAEILLKVALSTINQIIIYSTGLKCDRHKFDIYDIIMLRVSFCSDIWYYNILAYYLGSIFAYYLDSIIMILMWSCPGNMPKYYPGLRDILPDRSPCLRDILPSPSVG